MERQKAIRLAQQLVDKMTPEEMASQLRFDAPAIERLGIPAYNWWNEGLHGVARAGTATVFPQAIGLAATFDEELMKDIGYAISVEARAKYNEQSQQGDRDIYKGLTLWAPNVNLFRDPRWGRGQETFGEDPYLISRMAVSLINGLQGQDEYLRVAACAKHFAVHSGPEKQRHSFDAKVTDKDLWESYLPAFEACIKEAKVESVMGAYNRTNGEPCCAHTYLMQDVLRKKWGFEGHFVSDCWAIRDFHEHHGVTKTPRESVKLALETGCDLNCGCTYQHIMEAYYAGDISLELIRRAAIRVFTTRFLLGLFHKTEYDTIPYAVVECNRHLQLAEKAARESVVLLKNDGILPIHIKKNMVIGVIGPNADSRRALLGNYYGTPSHQTTVLQGIQDALGEQGRVLYSLGANLSRDREELLAQSGDRLSEAVAVARHSDVVVLCLGLDETLEGEEGDEGNQHASGDRETLALPASQQQLLETIANTGVPFIVCVLSGSCLDLNIANQSAGAILQAWYPGEEGGKAIADILFGKVSPSGKLPITFYSDLEGLPAFENYSMKGRTYRYLEKKPLYPFGYGLTYGDTKVLSLNIDESNSDAIKKEQIPLRIVVENTGMMETDDVIQIYIQVIDSVNEVPNPRLVAFHRVRLECGKTQELFLALDKSCFMTVDCNGIKSMDGNRAVIYVGFGQPDDITAQLSGTTSVSLECYLDNI